VNKLRRHEPFAMSRRDGPEVGHGRTARLLEELNESASSSLGLVVKDENGNAQQVGKPSVDVQQG
jgi:hypothetical protein